MSSVRGPDFLETPEEQARGAASHTVLEGTE